MASFRLRGWPPAAGGIDPIGQAAGLSAGTPVAAASSDNGAEGALTGVAHTKSAVGKDLHLRRTVPADGGNVPAGQLTGQHHTGKAQLCRPACAPQRVQAHLGAGVEGQLRRRLTGQLPHAPILYQHRICPQPGGLVQQLRRPRKLPVGEQGVQGQIDPHPRRWQYRTACANSSSVKFLALRRAL